MPTVGVIASLISGFIATGFASAAYRRERVELGQEHFEQAKLLESRGQIEASLEEFRRALFFSPDQNEYGISLATALVEAGKLDEASSHLDQLLQEDPTNGRLNLLLARVAVKNNNVKQAIEYYHRAVYEYWPPSELPARRQARWELAALLNKTGDQNGLVAELMQLYANLPAADVEQRLRVGFDLLHAGATSESYKVFAAVVQQWSQNEAAHAGLGEVDLKLHNYVSARHEFQRALRLNPKDEAAVQRLAFTNEIIDLDPFIPDLVAAERLRRSRNLLSAVVRDLRKCSSGADVSTSAPAPANAPTDPNTSPDQTAQRLAQAEDLLKQQALSTDLALQCRQMARALWNDRSTLCAGESAASDPAIEAVIEMMSYE